MAVAVDRFRRRDASERIDAGEDGEDLGAELLDSAADYEGLELLEFGDFIGDVGRDPFGIRDDG